MFDQLVDSDLTLSEESDIPLYFQLMTIIRRQIHAGILKPGDMVPPESQLCAQYKVSRTTVRLALSQLVEENLIIRRRGKGSFIASPKMQRSLNYLYNFTDDMLSAGLHPHSKLLESTIIKASADVKNHLNLPVSQTKVFKLCRLRIANNEPLLLETTYIPLYLCPNIAQEDFSTTSLYGILRYKYNLNLYRAVESYEPIHLNRESAALLNCRSSISAFNIQRITYLESNTPIELTYSIVRGDKCIFKVELYSNKNKVNFLRKIKV